jgi:EmrB/QacA subfamily drug resistance transporter
MTPQSTPARGWTLALTATASFIVALDGLVTATALTSIRHSFGASLAELQWTTNAFNLAFAVLISVGAALGDRFGRRLIFTLGLAVFSVASVGCALSGDVMMLIAGRALQGVGAALVLPVALAILSVAYPPDTRGKALGIFGGIMGLAVLAGPVIGGTIAEGIHWTWIFWINVPIGLVLVPLSLIRLQESRGAGGRIDAAGVVLLGGFALAATWGLMRGNEIGWDAIEVLGSLGTAALLAAALMARQRRARDPMLPPRLFAAKAFGAGLASAFFLYGALYGTLFFVAQFFQVAQGFGPLQAGLRLLPWTGSLFIVAPIAGALVNKLGERTLVVVGLALKAAGLAWVAAVAAVDAPFVALAPALVIAGAGVSLAMPPVQSGVMRSIEVRDLGKASGAFTMSRFVGGAFGIAVLAAVFSAFGGYESPAAFTAGFTAVMYGAAILAAAGALMATGLAGGVRKLPVAAAAAT